MRFKIQPPLLVIGIFIAGVLIGGTSTMLVARNGESQRIPSGSPTVPGLSCIYKDKTYRHGEGFKDECNSCGCQNGQVQCTLMGCGSDVDQTEQTGNPTDLGFSIDQPPTETPRRTNMLTYTNTKLGFSMGYPNGFVVKPQDVSGLAESTPTTVALMFFMNPTMAAGELPRVKPPDFAVKIYQAGAVNSLKDWLVSVGLVGGGDVVRPYRNVSISGLKVCRQAMMVEPNCSVYVLGNDRVYNFTTTTLEGEAMMETFTLLP